MAGAEVEASNLARTLSNLFCAITYNLNINIGNYITMRYLLILNISTGVFTFHVTSNKLLNSYFVGIVFVVLWVLC